MLPAPHPRAPQCHAAGDQQFRRADPGAAGSRHRFPAGAGPDGSGAAVAAGHADHAFRQVPGRLIADLPAVPGLVRAQGFPPGELGRLLALMHELDHNGWLCWRRCARRALARPGRSGRAGRALRRRCRANVTKCARTVLIGDVLLRMGPGRTNPSPSPKGPSPKRVQAPNRVQAPSGPDIMLFPQARTTTWNFRPMSR